MSRETTSILAALFGLVVLLYWRAISRAGVLYLQDLGNALGFSLDYRSERSVREFGVTVRVMGAAFLIVAILISASV